MDVNTGLNINLHLYDTDISVTVPRDDEKSWRDAAQLVNDRMNAYFEAYKGSKGENEIRYYVMLDIALKCIAEQQRNDVTPITDILSRLSSEIEEVIK